MSEESEWAVVGMDPHKRSVTIEVMTADGSVVGEGRYDTDAAGYRAMLKYPMRVAGSGGGD
ncbi:MAG: hypothetical protein ACRDQD_26835 [Nocardioidaceae bacterium]